MRKLIFIILLMLWSGLAITLMNDEKDTPKLKKAHSFKVESKSTYRPISDRG